MLSEVERRRAERFVYRLDSKTILLDTPEASRGPTPCTTYTPSRLNVAPFSKLIHFVASRDSHRKSSRASHNRPSVRSSTRTTASCNEEEDVNDAEKDAFSLEGLARTVCELRLRVEKLETREGEHRLTA